MRTNNRHSHLRALAKTTRLIGLGLCLIGGASLSAAGFPEYFSPALGDLAGARQLAPAGANNIHALSFATLANARRNHEAERWERVFVELEQKTDQVFAEKRGVETAWSRPNPVHTSPPAGRWLGSRNHSHATIGSDAKLAALQPEQTALPRIKARVAIGLAYLTRTGRTQRNWIPVLRPADYFSLRNGYIRRGHARIDHFFHPPALTRSGQQALSPTASSFARPGEATNRSHILFSPATLAATFFSRKPFVASFSISIEVNRGHHAPVSA